jgi:signal transduction histidine kinase
VVNDAIVSCRARYSLEYCAEYGIPRFRIDASIAGGPLVCDRQRVSQALTAIIDNAIKYSQPRKGGDSVPCVINIVARFDNRTAQVLVEDWGLALPQGDYRDLFRPFKRGKVHGTVRRVPGLGLGLHIANQAITAHGGTLRVSGRPTLDDYVRRHRDGNIVQAVVRIPTVNQVGNFVYSDRDGLQRETVMRRYPMSSTGGLS